MNLESWNCQIKEGLVLQVPHIIVPPNDWANAPAAFPRWHEGKDLVKHVMKRSEITGNHFKTSCVVLSDSGSCSHTFSINLSIFLTELRLWPPDWLRPRSADFPVCLSSSRSASFSLPSAMRQSVWYWLYVFRAFVSTENLLQGCFHQPLRWMIFYYQAEMWTAHRLQLRGDF